MSNRCLHGLIVARLIHKVESYLDVHPGGRCFAATRCVLSEQGEVDPDVCVLFEDRLGLARDVIEGAPDWVAEVLDEDDDPFTIAALLNRYRKAGVKEVWVVSPWRRAAWVGVGRESGWEAQPRHKARIESVLLPGLIVEIGPLFER